ncbi:MAG: hypothetical protein GY794_11465 [bacterium]|nr:hypothetical protein [bacterium]
MAGPDIRQNTVSHALVSLHDLAATFVDYAKALPMPETDALSLRALLSGQTDTHREHVLVGLDNDLGKWRMVFDGHYKLVSSPDQAPLLFDLEADPFEDANIAERHPEVVARLQALLKKGNRHMP